MSEIADAAGISKSLLFHYFHNKKELYLFLWENCAKLTISYLTRYGCYKQQGLFESMELGMHAKMELLHTYPDMASFTIRAFYEKDPEINAAVQESYHKYFNLKADRARINFDPKQFAEANRQLKEKYDSDPEFASKFNERQRDDIENGRTPYGYTWHHNEETGKLQLVDYETHANTRHTGGRAIWGGGSENR